MTKPKSTRQTKAELALRNVDLEHQVKELTSAIEGHTKTISTMMEDRTRTDDNLRDTGAKCQDLERQNRRLWCGVHTINHLMQKLLAEIPPSTLAQ